MKADPTKHHRWLKKLIGQWTSESQCSPAPDKPPQKLTGSETVRAIGDLWVVCDGKGEMPGGGVADMVMTLGFDPQTNRFVGTWIGSMMTHLWSYNGELDAAEKVLTLNSEGPDFTSPGKTARYRDVIEFVNDDYRTLSSHTPGPDGKWNQIMQVHYRRG